MVVCANAMPRSAIIWTRSRELSLNVKYHLMHRMMISWSKCRPLKRSCAEVGSVIPAVTAGSGAFQVCTRTRYPGNQGTNECWRVAGAGYCRLLNPYGPNPSPRPLEREHYPNNREAIAKDSPVGAKAGNCYGETDAHSKALVTAQGRLFRAVDLLGSGYNGFNEVIKSDWKGSKIRQKLANF
jgi:hypothetical protein